MARYRIEFEIEVEDGVEYDDVLAWARFNLHDNGILQGGNSLEDEIPEPIFGTFELTKV